MHKKLHLDNPVTFTEKIEWLKLYNRKPLYTKMVDKYEVKEYVAQRIGEQYVILHLAFGISLTILTSRKLPDQFVLKKVPMAVVEQEWSSARDKSKLDKETAKQLLDTSMNVSADMLQGEWVYKRNKPNHCREVHGSC